MLRLLPLLVLPLLPATLPTAAAQTTCPDLGATLGLPGDADVGPAGGEQRFPDVASGGGVHLAVWIDHRSKFTSLLTGQGTRDVFAMRLGPDGQPLDGTSFRVAGGLGPKNDAHVAWNGAHFLVTWVVESPTQFFKSAEIRGARVTPAGEIVDDPPLSIRKYDFSSSVLYGLASDGDGWAVVTQGTSAGEASVEGWLVAGDGTVSLGNASITPTASLIFDHELGFADDRYLYTYNDGPSVRGRFLTSGLAPIGGVFTVGSGGQPSVASDGRDFLVAWTGATVGGVVRYREVAKSGALGAVVEVAPASSIVDFYAPDVAWNGDGFTLAFSEIDFATYTQRAARVTKDGVLLDPVGVPVGSSASPQDPAVSSLGDGAGQLVWCDVEATPVHTGDVVGARVTPTAVEPQATLSVGRHRQGFADLAAGGPGYLAVYTSERDGSVSILAQRLDPAGIALDAEPFELAVGDTLGRPRAAWNGDHFLVVWEDRQVVSFVTDDVVLARRVSAAGAPLDPAPFFVLDGGTPDLAAAEGAFLVAARRADTTQIYRIYAARVVGGAVQGGPILVGGNFGRFPAVESFGDAWIVAWQRNPTHDTPSVNTLARVVEVDLAQGPVQSLGAGGLPGVAASPDVALVAWGGGDVRGRRIARTGDSLGTDFTISGAPEDQVDPSVAWNGSEFVVVWEDARNIDAFFDDRFDLYTTRVAEDGALLDAPDGCPLAATEEPEAQPVVASGGAGHLFGYSRFLPDAPDAAVRIALVPGAPWTTLGGGVAGASGVPALTGTGVLEAGGQVQLHVSGAGAGLPGGHAIGAATLDLPFAGGVLVPEPQVVRLFVTGPAGGASTTLPLPSDLPSGLQVWAQSWLLDATAPAGFAGSDAVTQVAP